MIYTKLKKVYTVVLIYLKIKIITDSWNHIQSILKLLKFS